MPYNCAPNNFIVNLIIPVDYTVAHTDNLFFTGYHNIGIKFINPVHGFPNNFRFRSIARRSILSAF